MAQHGGKRAGAGRKKGAVSQAKRQLADMAKDHAEAALKTLVDIMQNGEQESARLSAANSILDRGYGKPFQATVEVPLANVPEAFTGFMVERAVKPDTPDTH